MTTVSDGLFQYGGVPAGMGSGIPTTFGTYFFVDPDTTGAQTGDSMKNAFKYAGQANTKITTNKHDVVMFNANSAVNTASSNDEMTLTKNRTHWVGLGGGSRYFGQRTRWTMGVTTGSAIAIVQNTGVGNTFTNIKFDSGDTLSTSLYAFADGGEYTQMTNCEIVKSTDLDQTTSGVLLCNADSGYYKNCMIGSLVHQVSVNRPCVKFNRTTISGKVARDVVFEDCLFFLNTTATAANMLHGTGATDIERVLLLKNCSFINAILGTADPDEAVSFDSALTQGYCLIQGGGEVGCTALSTTVGVFTLNVTATAAGGSAIQCT